jgi:hypothetical protein
MTLPLPTEDTEQRIFVQWLRLQGLSHFRVPNETYTKSWSQKNKNKALGVSPGVPDLFVLIPRVGLLAIEMKRQKGGVVSPTQREWLDRLNEIPSVETFICRGANEAINTVKKFLEPHSPASSSMSQKKSSKVLGDMIF